MFKNLEIRLTLSDSEDYRNSINFNGVFKNAPLSSQSLEKLFIRLKAAIFDHLHVSTIEKDSRLDDQ